MNRALLAACLLVPAAVGRTQPVPDLTPTEFHELQDTLVPRHPEKWQHIPWKITLLEARALAVKTGQPLFMWSMNGNPLGCT